MGTSINGVSAKDTAPRCSPEYIEKRDEFSGEQWTNMGFAARTGTERNAHFPACVDRIIYWSPDSLDCHISSEKGYEVLHKESRSDHKPVITQLSFSVGPA